jgi:hypothetical protein
VALESARVEHVDAVDDPLTAIGLDAAADNLDFGKFRH